MSEATIGIGILGTAHVVHATSYAGALTGTPGAALLGVYDDDPDQGQAFAQRFGVPFYPTAGDLLACADLHGVVVCGPTVRHRPLVEAAAGRGKHVLCEKPIATSLEDGQAMIDACRAAGVQLHLAYTSRFYPVAGEARRAIAAGEIGQVIGLRGGNRGIAPLPGHGDHPAWLLDAALAGGGAVIDHSVHVTDLMRYLTGDEVESVWAEMGTLLHPELPVEDCAVLLLRFRGGAVASVDPSWSIPAGNPFLYDLVLHVVGSEGAILLDDTRQALRLVRDRLVHEPFGLNIDAALVQAFVASIRHGQVLPPCATGEDGQRSLEIALAAYQAAATGRVVGLPRQDDNE